MAYGDRTTLSDANVFSVQPPLLYFGSATIQLQTSGISFLQPQIEVYDQNFNLLGEAQSTSDFGDIVSVQLPNVNPFKHYYIEVNSPSQDVFGTGRYALSVTFNDRIAREPGQLARHPPRTVRFSRRGGHCRASRNPAGRALQQHRPRTTRS